MLVIQVIDKEQTQHNPHDISEHSDRLHLSAFLYFINERFPDTMDTDEKRPPITIEYALEQLKPWDEIRNKA